MLEKPHDAANAPIVKINDVALAQLANATNSCVRQTNVDPEQGAMFGAHEKLLKKHVMPISELLALPIQHADEHCVLKILKNMHCLTFGFTMLSLRDETS